VILISADINVLRSSAKRRPMNQHSTPLGIPPRESLLGTVGISRRPMARKTLISVASLGFRQSWVSPVLGFASLGLLTSLRVR
jgi:hypothetical protein